MTNETMQRWDTVADFNQSNFPKRHVFLLFHRNDNPSFREDWGNKTGIHFPTSFGIRLQEDIFDKEKRVRRTMRVVEGETSIWADEQTRYKDTPMKQIPVRTVRFYRGELVVTENETQLLEFLTRSEWNLANQVAGSTKPTMFLKLNVAAALKNVMSDKQKEFKMQEWCFNGPWEECFAYARLLGIPVDGKEPEEVRFSLLERAKTNPDKFIAGMHLPILKRKYWIEKAVQMGILLVDKQLNAVKWSNGQAILAAPPEVSPVDYLCDRTIVDQFGGTIFESIKGMVDTMDNQKVAPLPTKLTAESVPNPGQPMAELLATNKLIEQKKALNKKASEMTYEEWLDACKDKGLIAQNTGRFTIDPQNKTGFYAEGADAVTLHGHKKLKEWLQEDGKAFAQKTVPVLDDALDGKKALAQTDQEDTITTTPSEEKKEAPASSLPF